MPVNVLPTKSLGRGRSWREDDEVMMSCLSHHLTLSRVQRSNKLDKY